MFVFVAVLSLYLFMCRQDVSHACSHLNACVQACVIACFFLVFVSVSLYFFCVSDIFSHALNCVLDCLGFIGLFVPVLVHERVYLCNVM